MNLERKILSGILVSVLCCGLAFVQPGFALPQPPPVQNQDPPVNPPPPEPSLPPPPVFPDPAAEMTDDPIDWLTEVRVLEELRRKSDAELTRLNDELMVQTTAHLEQANIRAEIAVAAVAIASGVALIWVGLRCKSKINGRSLGMRLGLAGLAVTAFGIFYTGGIKGRALTFTQQLSQKQLRDVVGGDVARNLEELRDWMTRVEWGLRTKDFLFALPDVDQVQGGFDFLTQLDRLALDFTRGHQQVTRVELDAYAVITEDGDTEEDARNYIRVAADNTPKESLRDIRRLLYERVLEVVSGQDVVLTSALHRLSPDRFPSFLDDVAKKRVSLGIVTEHFVFKNPAYQRWQRMPTYEFSVADVLEAGTPELRLSLEYVFSDGKDGMRFW